MAVCYHLFNVLLYIQSVCSLDHLIDLLILEVK